MSTTGLLVTYAKCVRAAEEPAWDEWEDTVHVPAVCADGGPWATTRFELTARPQPGMPGIGFTHVTIYELDDRDVNAQAARAIACDATLRDDGRMHPAHVAVGADVIVIRHPSSGAARVMAAHLDIPVINAGDGMHEHPTQALLDAYTILQHKKSLKGVQVAIIGDILHSRVARSDCHLLSKLLGEHLRESRHVVYVFFRIQGGELPAKLGE